ncbi:hypothetical protein AX14_000261 [Amanita brunnescens Koide BX004]|nr:hypothetical protein AX14_000261 [Amanita brunnescens Koide BX004]
MASITFSSDASQFYPPSFDTSASFQVNPLGAHPPRSSHNAADLGDNPTIDEKTAPEDVELDEQEDKVKQVEGRVRKEDVWDEMFLTSNGRDKAFKLIQYSIRAYLLLHNAATTSRFIRQPTRAPWNIELVKRLESTANGLSFTRKLLLLFNWLSPLSIITAQQTVPFSLENSSQAAKTSSRPFLHALLHTRPPVLLEFIHGLADDAATYSKLGLFSKRFGQRAERFSDWCWLLATLVGLVENGVERQMIVRLQTDVQNRLYKESMTGATAKSNPRATKADERELKRLQRQDYWLRITRAKLLMDLIFVSYDLFNIKWAREPVKASTGLIAAILSSAKLYDRHKTSLLKKTIAS